MTKGLRQFSMHVSSSKISVALDGDADTLDLLRSQIKTGSEFATATAATQKENLADAPLEGAAAILGYYHLENMTRFIKPVISGDRLSLEFSVGDLGGTAGLFIVSGVGILSAVAIPAFMKYIKKSKTAEASQFLRKLQDGARMVYLETGRFPASVGPTPPLGACCAQG